METKASRGGRRQRRYAKKDSLGRIDREGIFDLLKQLAPNVTEERWEFALTITVKGIEIHREHAPIGPTLATPVQKNRRALTRFKGGSRGEEIAPFNGLLEFNGRLFGTSSSGLYEIEDIPLEDPYDPYEGLDKAVANPLRTLASIHQRAAGFSHINPNLPFNPPSSVGDAGVVHTVADVLLDDLAKPKDWDAELAGYVYLAITRGLSISASMFWYEAPPKKSNKGWNFGRLLSLAAMQAGAVLPSGRDGMEGLMKNGKACADEMLAPAITYADGRTFSAFEIEFPDV